MKKHIILFFVIILFAKISTAYSEDWEEIKKVAENIKSVSADFTQEKHMKILVKPLVSNGRFLFTAPNSLRWEYFSPVKSILLMYNGSVRSFIEGKNGLVEDTGMKAQAMGIVTQEITSWLKGRFRDDPNFLAELSTGESDKIFLTPKEKALANIISGIEIEVSRKEGIIKSVKIIENKDSYTLIKFTGSVHNKDIEEKIYKDI